MRLCCVEVVTGGPQITRHLYIIRANRLQQAEQCAREALRDDEVIARILRHEDVLHSPQRAASAVPGGL